MIFRAPGKLFLIGEYSVLDGGEALVAAVDRHAVIRTSRANRPTWSDPEGTQPLVEEGGAAALPPRAALVQAVAETLLAEGMRLAPVVVSADSSSLSGDQKLGLGSSGAVCVGLVRALAPAATVDDALDLALRAHRRFQSGRGSGGDVIASAMGGLSVVSPGRLLRHIPRRELPFAVFDTGVAADTRTRVDQFHKWRASHPGAAGTLRALKQTTSEAILALERGDLRAWCEGVREFAGLEREMTRGGVDIFAEPVERVVSTLEDAGWSAKPSGAGGGDVVVAFHPDASPDSLDSLSVHGGLSRIPLAIEWSGVLEGPR